MILLIFETLIQHNKRDSYMVYLKNCENIYFNEVNYLKDELENNNTGPSIKCSVFYDIGSETGINPISFE